MKKLLLTIIVALTSMITSAQEKEYNDGFFVAYLTDTNDKDVKCDVYPSEVSEQDIQNLMDGGRYITSVIYTKSGGIVLHRANTDNIKQIYTICSSWNLKKLCKQKFKEGYVLNYYNSQRKYAIFNHNPKAKVMKFISTVNFDQKKLDKLNQKGMFVTIINSYTYIAYDGQDNIKKQIYEHTTNHGDNIVDKFGRAPKTNFISSVTTSYNKYGNTTYYKYINNVYKDGRQSEQSIGNFENVDNFIKYLKGKVTSRYNLVGLWGGWENRDYKADEARAAAADDMNIFDILSGLTNSISGLTGHGNGNASTYNTPESGGTGSTYNQSAGSKSGTGKCRRCNGSGKCSPTSGGGRKNACHGSGLCGYCSGTGWIKAGGSEAKCTACNGKGKCKTCGGTGKCPVCHGSGK